MIYTLHRLPVNSGEYQPPLSESFYHSHSHEDQISFSKLSEDLIPEAFKPLRSDDIIRNFIMHAGTSVKYGEHELVNTVITDYKRLYPNSHELKLNVNIYR